MRSRVVTLGVVLTLVSGLALLLIMGWYYDSRMRAYYYDIGQGDASLIITPDKYTVLIDTGPDAPIVDKVKKSLPIWEDTIDYVIISHEDTDHVGGLVDLLSSYRVANIFINLPVVNYKSDSIRKIVGENNVAVTELFSHSDFRIGCCLNFDILWPVKDSNWKELAANDRSIAFVASYGEVAVYYGGDLSSRIEDKLEIDSRYSVDVLKVGHHGSKTSTSRLFLDEMSPEYCIIMLQKDNKYGHPHQSVLDNLELSGCKIYRTDLNKTILMSTDGKSMEWQLNV